MALWKENLELLGGVVLLCFTFLNVGCGTVASYVVPGNVDAGARNPYLPPKGIPMFSGVRFDLLLVGTNFQKEPFLPWSILAILDLPLSFALDAILLPGTLLWWLSSEPQKEKETSPPEEKGQERED